MTRLVNEADIVNKTRPLFTLSLEMTRLVNETRLLLVPSVNSDVYSIWMEHFKSLLHTGQPLERFMMH